MTGEELLEVRYDGERVVNPHHEGGEESDDEVTFMFTIRARPIRYHLIIEDGVERVSGMGPLLYRASIYRGDIKKITMANSVKTLGDGAFNCFANLEEVIWSENLETIGEQALEGCERLGKYFGLTNFLPPTCRLIGPHAFADTQCLDMIIIPEHTLVHPSAFNGSLVWESSPVHKDAIPRELINWIKNHQHDTYPIHAMFAKTQFNPEEILNELCNNDEYLSSFSCNKLYKDKDRYGLTPMDYLHRNPFVDETQFDELKLVKASMTRIMRLDGV
ncbi:hypothetical protein CTEN210_07589 [Chaetoceros tenuissimus]|uniref:Leucine-rich repeat domain-containing protein n=1 Tax=Chaetoceros tenuissimus TaxID=426638 RepID=A0AAD3CS11_9STRA|nr:hypothetical protein CTEN210_07589 [Chaetoceros tenuissimus]